MRILYYNWVDYFDAEKRGGGVTVYQRNVLKALKEQDGIETVFLSAGISYDLFSGAPRWEKVRHGASEDREKRFELINSGVMSPGHHSFGNPAQIDHPETVATFLDFVQSNGPFDVIHFNNLEGLPASVLALKEELPDTKFIFSLHNYYPICPQVNLWRQEKENCLDFDNGRKCETCIDHRPDERVIRLANGVAFNMKKGGIEPGTRLFDRAFMPAMRWAGRSVRAYARMSEKKRLKAATPTVPKEALADPSEGSNLLTPIKPSYLGFAKRRKEIIRYMNTYCDKVLCVSDRVGEVAEKFGIDPDLLQTSYIGTEQAKKFQETKAKPTMLKADGSLTLAYLGYMRRDKGFFFLLDSLSKLKAEKAKRINLVFCARRGDDETMWRVTQLSEKFKSVQFADGYTHEHLDELLEDVDVGVVPVLWEDNLPQVAIEMHARHIPLLTSDLGGAKELGNCPSMVFKSGNFRSFEAKITSLLEGGVTMEGYWQNALPPVSMVEHIRDLLTVYSCETSPLVKQVEGSDLEILPEPT